MTQRLVLSEQLATQSRAALTSRAVIDQAVGMVMVQRRCTADEALTALSTESQQRDIKLLDLCAELVAGQTSATPLQQPPPR